MKKIFLFIFASFLVLSFNGCSQKKAVAMNLYEPNAKEPVKSATVVVTKEMIQEVKKRREKYLKEHGAI
jgi:ABC-type Zn uptake system ZnuABC Zn-binding protein ZnuA